MQHRLALAISLAIFGTLVLVSPAAAQRGFGAKPAPRGPAGPRGSWGTVGRGASGFAHPVHPMFRGRVRSWGRGPGWGWAYLPLPDYYDYPSAYEPAMAQAPYEPAEAPPWERAAPEKVIQPLLLEKQGDQWVKVTGYPEASAGAEPAPPRAAEAAPSRAVMPNGNKAAEPPREVPPAVLVFRDGHEEEIKSYTIIGNTIYASTNYWTSGSWTRPIEIFNLDVPATLKRNQERGSKFSLPSSPQEVVIRL